MQWETGVRTSRIRLVWMGGRRCLSLRPKSVFEINLHLHKIIYLVMLS